MAEAMTDATDVSDVADLLAVACELIAREGSALDESRWDDWLAMYERDCEYWVPTWVEENRLAQDPQSELSHIYYANRHGLEDRLTRVRSGKSPASTPLRRTTHMTSNVVVQAGSSAQQIDARSSWTCHVFDPSGRGTFMLFGRAEYRLVRREGEWRIARKMTVVNNDYLPAMADFYCI